MEGQNLLDVQIHFKYLCWVEDDVIYSEVPMNQAFFIIIRRQVVC